jgi:hypothetical protein
MMPCISPVIALRKLSLIAVYALAFALLFRGAPARAQADPAVLSAKDTHQGLLVAADPYSSAARSKIKFGKHTPFEGGILAVDVYFRNDNDSPVRINPDTVRLSLGEEGRGRQRLDAISADDVADRTLLKSPKDPRGPRIQIPLPGGIGRSGRDKNWQEFDGILRSAAMSSSVIPPHGAVHGCFYFDIAGHFDWLADTTLEIPDLSFMIGDKPLFFFEIDLSKAAP